MGLQNLPIKPLESSSSDQFLHEFLWAGTVSTKKTRAFYQGKTETNQKREYVEELGI